jgi:hypothetical protein
MKQHNFDLWVSGIFLTYSATTGVALDLGYRSSGGSQSTIGSS